MTRAASQSVPPELLTTLLRDVSRSFYLTLRVLPASIRPSISLAYLLARATDTVADTEILPPSERLDALQRLKNRILGTSTAPLNFEPLLAHQHNRAERVLLARIEEALRLLGMFEPDDLQRMREVLATITSGQELDLQRFGAAQPGQPLALESEEELDDYTYRVAGCVGEFWTHMCRAHLFPQATIDMPTLLSDGIRFGKGLQLINILRDIPGDLRKGRCYLPRPQLSALGLAPADLLNPANQARVRPVYDLWLEKAQAHIAAGWNYTNALPRGCVRVRLACAWPILIGARTLERLRHANILDSAQLVKITRSEVRSVLTQSILLYPFRSRWQQLLERHSQPAR